jgi:hypothetical protein
MPALPETMRIVHLAALALWGGMVLAEAVVELLPLRRKELLPSSAVFHYYIDLYVEIPLLALVVATGAANLIFVPVTPLLVVKLAAAALAAGAQVACIVLVVRRHRLVSAGGTGPVIDALHRRIIACALFGVPFALVAVVIGLFISATLLAAR